MTRVLAVSDEVREVLWRPAVRRLQPDVLLSAGDLPLDYLAYLADTLEVPFAYVPGNHDPEWSSLRLSRAGVYLRSGLPAADVRPAGGLNADGAVVELSELRVAGLGGSVRYRDGPNQYTESEQARRARKLVRGARREFRRGARPIDVLLTHSPPRGVGDGDDAAHRGFQVLHDVVERLAPRYLLHGHIHPYGLRRPDRQLGDTTVVNVVGYKVLDL